MSHTGLFYQLWPRFVAHALEAEGVQTWDGLAALSARQLLTHKRFGKHALAFVADRLDERGLSLLATVQHSKMREALKTLHGVGGVYFLACDGFIKIGRARNVKTRLKGIETLIPFPISMAHVIPCGVPEAAKLEADLHARFQDLRHRGEWFRHEGALREFIEAAHA